MRNKIKQLLKKEGGFTLVELLAVLAILALIVGIAIPMIGNVITNAEKSTNTAQTELVEDAAQIYFLDNGGQTTVTIDKLIKDGYLEEYEGAQKEKSFNKEEILGKKGATTTSESKSE